MRERQRDLVCMGNHCLMSQVSCASLKVGFFSSAVGSEVEPLMADDAQGSCRM